MAYCYASVVLVTQLHAIHEQYMRYYDLIAFPCILMYSNDVI